MQPPVEYIARITEKYASLGFGTYDWVHSEAPPPWQPLTKPLSECRLGLIASGGLYASGQIAFHFKDDYSFRILPKTVDTKSLRTAHFAYDQTDARQDPNVVFPIDSLRRLVREGVIGGLADNLFTFMGGIYSARRVRDLLAPELVRRVIAEGVDAVLLVPV